MTILVSSPMASDADSTEDRNSLFPTAITSYDVTCALPHLPYADAQVRRGSSVMQIPCASAALIPKARSRSSAVDDPASRQVGRRRGGPNSTGACCPCGRGMSTPTGNPVLKMNALVLRDAASPAVGADDGCGVDIQRRAGRDFDIELTREDARNLHADLTTLLSADGAQLCAWLLALNADAGVATPTAREIRSAADTAAGTSL